MPRNQAGYSSSPANMSAHDAETESRLLGQQGEEDQASIVETGTKG